MKPFFCVCFFFPLALSSKECGPKITANGISLKAPTALLLGWNKMGSAGMYCNSVEVLLQRECCMSGQVTHSAVIVECYIRGKK